MRLLSSLQGIVQPAVVTKEENLLLGAKNSIIATDNIGRNSILAGLLS